MAYFKISINGVQPFKRCDLGTSPVVQWLRLHAPNEGGRGSIPGRGTGPHMPQLKIPHVTTETWRSQINNYFT